MKTIIGALACCVLLSYVGCGGETPQSPVADKPDSERVSAEKSPLTAAGDAQGKQPAKASARYEVDVRYTKEVRNTSPISRRPVLYLPVVTTVVSTEKPQVVLDADTGKHMLTIAGEDGKKQTIACDEEPVVREIKQ